jgi:hypothetical protein
MVADLRSRRRSVAVLELEFPGLGGRAEFGVGVVGDVLIDERGVVVCRRSEGKVRVGSDRVTGFLGRLGAALGSCERVVDSFLRLARAVLVILGSEGGDC